MRRPDSSKIIFTIGLSKNRAPCFVAQLGTRKMEHVHAQLGFFDVKIRSNNLYESVALKNDLLDSFPGIFRNVAFI